MTRIETPEPTDSITAITNVGYSKRYDRKQGKEQAYLNNAVSDLNPDRVTVAGDWHGNYKYTVKAMNWIRNEHRTNVVVHVGDFGVWPHSDGSLGFISGVETLAAERNMVILFVDGNHENFDWLLRQPISDDGVRRLTDHVWHLPRGFRWRWQDKIWLACGGAYSIDKMWRRKSVDWFPEEEINGSDWYECWDNGQADVMVTHDCPYGVPIPLEGNGISLPPSIQSESDSHRLKLREITDDVQPMTLFHGHYHVRYDYEGPVGKVESMRVHGLDCDGKPKADNLLLVDCKDLPGRPPRPVN